MVHIVRFMNQNSAIKNLMSKINGDSDFCVVIMEFKMKFETMKHLESAVENLEGVVYHGIAILFSIMFKYMLILMYMM